MVPLELSHHQRDVCGEILPSSWWSTTLSSYMFSQWKQEVFSPGLV